MQSKFQKRYMKRRDARIRVWAKTMPIQDVARKAEITPQRVYQILKSQPT